MNETPQIRWQITKVLVNVWFWKASQSPLL